jgi:hypothetical protein
MCPHICISLPQLIHLDFYFYQPQKEGSNLKHANTTDVLFPKILFVIIIDPPQS